MLIIVPATKADYCAGCDGEFPADELVEAHKANGEVVIACLHCIEDIFGDRYPEEVQKLLDEIRR